jgi:hypothetical protein
MRGNTRRASDGAETPCWSGRSCRAAKADVPRAPRRSGGAAKAGVLAGDSHPRAPLVAPKLHRSVGGRPKGALPLLGSPGHLARKSGEARSHSSMQPVTVSGATR